MKNRAQRPTRLLVAVASLTLGWWLFDVAGYWLHGQSLRHFLPFLLCVLGIDRIMSAAIDLVTIALAPIETIKRRE